jgi:tricarballylate dehydrogenase
MALEVGAATSGAFDGIHSEMVDARTTQPDSVIWGHCYGIVVNKHCKRFYDEGKRHLFATFEMIALETWRDQDNEAYLIFDKPVADKFIPGWVYQTTDKDPEIANTIPELAEKLGLDPKRLEDTVNEFNAACNDKPWDTMKLDGKATTGLSPNKSNWANPIAKGPFYGFPLKTTLTFTYGGLKTDLESRVVAPNNVPIPGLYAAGELTGAFYHEVSCLHSRAWYFEIQDADT